MTHAPPWRKDYFSLIQLVIFGDGRLAAFWHAACIIKNKATERVSGGGGRGQGAHDMLQTTLDTLAR